MLERSRHPGEVIRVSDFEDVQESIEELIEAVDEPGATRYLDEAKVKVVEAKRMYDWERQG